MSSIILSIIGEGCSLYSTNFALHSLLFFDLFRVDIGLFGCGGIFDVNGRFDAFIEVALVAILGYFSISFCIKVFGFDSWDVPYVSRYM